METAVNDPDIRTVLSPVIPVTALCNFVHSPGGTTVQVEDRGANLLDDLVQLVEVLVQTPGIDKRVSSRGAGCPASGPAHTVTTRSMISDGAARPVRANNPITSDEGCTTVLPTVGRTDKGAKDSVTGPEKSTE